MLDRLKRLAVRSQAVIGDRLQGQRAYVQRDGNLYLARDVIREYRGRTRYYPEHAVVLADGRLAWRPHPEGGMMEPLIEGYDSPGCEWRRL